MTTMSGYSTLGLLLSTVIMMLSIATNTGASSAQKISKLPLEILDVVVTPHQYSDVMRYRTPPDPELGALVRIYIASTDDACTALQPELTFNNKRPDELLASGDWMWYEMPENLGTDDAPFQIGPGELAVFTFNAATSNWGIGNQFQLGILDKMTGTHTELTLPIRMNPIRIHQIVCLASEASAIIPDKMVVHLSNSGEQELTLREMKIYPDLPGSTYRQAVIRTRPDNQVIAENSHMIVIADTGSLPLTHGMTALTFENVDGDLVTCWARLRFKVDRFDIGSGWLFFPSKEDIVPLHHESFLKTLQWLHVNLFWGDHVPGYTDQTGPDGLYTRFPMRQMGFFEDIETFNSDEWVSRIHGVDRLGEPQHSRMPPMEVYEHLKKYDAARYPTTLTLSDEKDWRYYAGLADFPHYDSYRVSAPAADAWWLYDVWDEPVRWGAPLETIGIMTRSLRSLSEPLPIALWSQNVHEGWQGQRARLRRSPTPDEILIQAYQGLANGVISLYWYSLQSWSVLKFRDTLEMTHRIGREIRLLDDLYLTGYPTFFVQEQGDKRPMLDINVLGAPDAALLFAIDLTYYPDHEARVFTFGETRDIAVSFELPAWLRDPVDVFRIDVDGVYDVEWEITEDGVHIKDNLDRVAIYIAAQHETERGARLYKLNLLKNYEASIGFDPFNNEDDFNVLLNDLGFKDIRELDAFD